MTKRKKATVKKPRKSRLKVMTKTEEIARLRFDAARKVMRFPEQWEDLAVETRTNWLRDTFTVRRELAAQFLAANLDGTLAIAIDTADALLIELAENP